MIKLNDIIKESSGISGDRGSSISSGNNSPRWTPTGQERKVRIEQLSGYEQVDFPIADSVDISNEKHHWIAQSQTAKYHNKVRAVRGADGVLKLENKSIKLKNIMVESNGMFKHNIQILPNDFNKFSTNYKKLNPNNKVVKDTNTMRQLNSEDDIYIGFNSKTKDVHWRWIGDMYELHIDSGKVTSQVWDLIRKFDKIKDTHIWK